MRRRLTALLLGILGLGVPFIVAWLARRSEAGGRPPAGMRGPVAIPAPRAGIGGELGTEPEPSPVLPERGNRAGGAPSIIEPHPTGIFAAIGRFDYRFRRLLPILGLAVIIGVNAWAQLDGGKLIQGGWVVPGSEEQQASQLLASRFGETATTVLVIYTDPAGHAASDAFQAEVKTSLVDAAKDPAVKGVLTYAETHSEQLVSRDGTMTMAVLTLDKPVESSIEDAARLAKEVHAPAGVKTQVTGIPLLYHEFNQKIEGDLVRAEMVSLPIALVILLAVFGTVVAASLPLVIAGFALPTAFAVIRLLAGPLEMSVFVNNLASMIGLALAIDYSLFLVSRFREELRYHSVEVAVERMMGSVGKAVAISGVAVAIGLSSLIAFEAAALRSMGIAGIVTVLSTLVFALTVLPALLAMLGPRVNRFRVPLPAVFQLHEDDPDLAAARHGRGVWSWIAARVMKRPILIAIPVLAILLAAGSPFLSIELSTGQNLEDLPDTPSRDAILAIVNHFPGGESDPVVVAVTWPGADLNGSLSPERQAELSAYIDRLTKVSGVEEVQSALTAPAGLAAAQYQQLLAVPAAQRPAQAQAVNAYLVDLIAKDTTKVTVYSKLLPDSDAGRALVADIRAVAPPTGAQVLTGGLPSRSADFMSSFWHSIPIAILIVVLVTGGILFLTFGSIFLPMKAVLMSLISISASFGALVFVFQQGHLSGQLGFTPSGAIGAWLPLIMFAVLFGLSMDYEVLLLSRIRERYLATGDNTRAVAEGIGITGGIITGAALIMVAVFAAFGLSSIIFIKALGLTMALAVLIDATIVRGLLVPAFMRVMGRINWWAPRWVQRAIARIGLYEPEEPPATAAPRRAAPGSIPAR